MTDLDVTRKDLKIQALLEKVSALTTQYENQASDFRVEITLLTHERDQLKAQVDAFEETDAVVQANPEEPIALGAGSVQENKTEDK